MGSPRRCQARCSACRSRKADTNPESRWRSAPVHCPSGCIRGAALGLSLVGHVDHIVGGDGASQLAADALAGVLVAHGQRLDRSPVRGRIEYEIESPDLVPALCPQPLRRHSARPQPVSLHCVRPHPQAFLAPQPLYPLPIHHPAFPAHPRVRYPIPEPPPLPLPLTPPHSPPLPPPP